MVKNHFLAKSPWFTKGTFLWFFWCGTLGTRLVVTPESFVEIRSAVWPATDYQQLQLFDEASVSPQTPLHLPLPTGPTGPVGKITSVWEDWLKIWPAVKKLRNTKKCEKVPPGKWLYLRLHNKKTQFFLAQNTHRGREKVILGDQPP